MSEHEYTEPKRCRLVAVLDASMILDPRELSAVFSAGDIASLIITSGELDESAFQALADPIAKLAQSHGIAVIVANEPRVAARIGADGIQLGQNPDAIREAVDQYAPKLMVGAANVKTRHNALVIGELQPDYVMFGKPGGDIKPEPHPKNIDLGIWWSAMVEIPCIVLGGNDVQSAVDVARCGAEFVALGSAIFVPHKEGGLDIDRAVDRVRKANELLDKHAPQFEAEDA